MPRKIIVVDRVDSGDYFQVRAAFWLAPPVKSRPIVANRQSAVPNATAGELDSIANGAIVERVHLTGNLPTATTDLEIQAQLVTQYELAQSQINQELKGGTALGSFWDGTTWTSTGGVLVATP